jgi:hypothetical protein
MSQIDSDELWKRHHDGQDKYTYFLLAAAGAANWIRAAEGGRRQANAVAHLFFRCDLGMGTY